jgi:structural maintenance of chromosome 3 (chondroitin sulfate proteoglycan 6)
VGHDVWGQVAGTKVYEERREESLQIMHETNIKRENIKEMVSYIEKRLTELEEEKEELKQYQQLDKVRHAPRTRPLHRYSCAAPIPCSRNTGRSSGLRLPTILAPREVMLLPGFILRLPVAPNQDRRALEYTLYDKELKQAREDLARTEESRLEQSERSVEVHKQLHDLRDALTAIDEKLAKLMEELGRKKEDRGAVEKEREGLIAERERCTHQVTDLTEKIRREAEAQVELKAKLEQAAKEIASVKRTLDERVEPAYQEAKERVDELKGRLKDCERVKTALYDKQGG